MTIFFKFHMLMLLVDHPIGLKQTRHDLFEEANE